MHVLVLPVHEQQVDPADADVHQLGVVPLAGVKDALVAKVLALEQVTEVSDDVEDDEGVEEDGGEGGDNLEGEALFYLCWCYLSFD